MLSNEQFYKLFLYYHHIGNIIFFEHLINVYYNIVNQDDKLNYIYHNLLHLKADNYIWRLLDNIEINLLTIKHDACYDDRTLEKMMYIVAIAVKKNITHMSSLVNKYLSHVLSKGNKFTKMYCSLLSFYIATNYDVGLNYDYVDGLIQCLLGSKKWFDEIHYFYNGTVIYSCHIYDIFIHIIKIFYLRNDYFNTKDLILLSRKKDMLMFKDFVALRYEEDEIIHYIVNSI